MHELVFVDRQSKGTVYFYKTSFGGIIFVIAEDSNTDLEVRPVTSASA